MFQVIDFAQLTMDSRPSAARFILSGSKGGDDNVERIRDDLAVVQRSLPEATEKSMKS
jgi:hypothetical protein